MADQNMNKPKKDFTPAAALLMEHGLDRGANLRAEPAWIATCLADHKTRFMILCDLKAAILSNRQPTGSAIRWFSSSELAKLGLEPLDALYLGCEGDRHHRFALILNDLTTDLKSTDLKALQPLADLRSLAVQGAMAGRELAHIATARSLAVWHNTHHYCGRCGTGMKMLDGGWRRHCPSCDQQAFPRTDPAVIMLVRDGDHCLLGQGVNFPDAHYSTLAGFVEPGETIEQAVRREVKEETNIDTGDICYRASQPWPFPHALMIGCTATALTRDITIDPAEIVDARWFSRDETRAMLEQRHPDGFTASGPHSIAYQLIAEFVQDE